MALYSLHHGAIGRSTHAAGTAGAHVRYVTREGAMTDHVERLPSDVDDSPRAVKAWVDGEELADRTNARVVDKLMVALPRELDVEQRRELVKAYCDELTQGQVPYYAAIHAGPKDEDNPHAHIILRDRDFETGRRVLQTSEKGSTDRFREAWETAANRALERAGREERIDRRSLKDQGIDREPDRHEGPNVRAMEERQLPTRIGDEVRTVRAYNQAVDQERGAVIDFQKAKDALDRERGILDRYEARMRTRTWDEEGSLAVAEVERANGGPVERAVIRARSSDAQYEVSALERERMGLDRRQDEIVRAVKTAHELRAEIEPLQKALDDYNSWWRKFKDRVGEWDDRRRLKKAVLSVHVDPLIRSMEGRAEARRRAYSQAERLKELPDRIHRALEGKPENTLRQEWEQNHQTLGRIRAQEREAKARVALYKPADEGYGRHDHEAWRDREHRIARDPEIQARHKERLRSGVWHPDDSRQMKHLELEAGGPVTRKWLDEQAAKHVGQADAYTDARDSMDHADELKGYKRDRARHVPGVERDRTIEKELKDIGREAIKELDPDRYLRTLTRDRSRDYGGWDRGGR